MSSKKETAKENKKESARDKMLQETVLQLTQAFPALKDSLGDKKFDKRIRKAAKILVEGIKKEEENQASAHHATAVAKTSKVASPAKKTAKKVVKKAAVTKK